MPPGSGVGATSRGGPPPETCSTTSRSEDRRSIEQPEFGAPPSRGRDVTVLADRGVRGRSASPVSPLLYPAELHPQQGCRDSNPSPMGYQGSAVPGRDAEPRCTDVEDGCRWPLVIWNEPTILRAPHARKLQRCSALGVGRIRLETLRRPTKGGRTRSMDTDASQGSSWCCSSSSWASRPPG